MNKETDRMKLAYWAKIIRESKTSGMKVSEWCVSNQISIRKYYYWHKKVMHSTYTLAVENLRIKLSIPSTICIPPDNLPPIPQSFHRRFLQSTLIMRPDQQNRLLQTMSDRISIIQAV